MSGLLRKEKPKKAAEKKKEEDKPIIENKRLVRRDRLDYWKSRGYKAVSGKDARSPRKRLLGVKTFDEMVLVSK
jgi:hypothetical protein